MRSLAMTLSALVLVGLIAMLAACARMNTGYSLPDTHPEALASGQQADCSECHEDQQKGTMKAYASFSHSTAFVRNHRFYAASDDRLCTVCHKSSFCNDCHANQVDVKPTIKYGKRPEREMPHRGDFMALHKIEGKLYPAGCYRCHGRDYNEKCKVCHH